MAPTTSHGTTLAYTCGMQCWWRVSLLLLFAALSTPARADVVTTKDGERIEGLIIETAKDSIIVRWGAGRAVITRRIAREAIASIKLSPPDIDGLRELARRSELQGDHKNAADIYRVMCTLKPESADDQLRRARALRTLGQLDEAASAALAASRLDATDARIPLERGEIAFARGDYRGATQLALDAIKSASARTAEGSAPAAVEGRWRLIEGNWLLARALEHSSQTDDAIAAYRKVLALDATHVGALERVSHLYFAQQSLLEAENVARDFIRAAPDARAGRIALGIALYRQARYGEAVDALRSATSLGGPGYDRARIFLHCARARSADTDPAGGLTEAELATARELDPELGRKKP